MFEAPEWHRVAVWQQAATLGGRRSAFIQRPDVETHRVALHNQTTCFLVNLGYYFLTRISYYKMHYTTNPHGNIRSTRECVLYDSTRWYENLIYVFAEE